MLSAPPEEKLKLEVAQKQLQLMDHCIKLNRIWSGKSNQGKALAEFDRAWASLMTFTESPPPCLLKCNFMWELLCEVRACQGPYLMVELKLSVLQRRMLGKSDDELRKCQHKYMLQGVVNCLTNAQSLNDCENRLRITLTPFESPEVRGEFSQEFLSQVADLTIMLDPGAARFMGSDADALAASVSRIPDKAPAEPTSCLDLLVKFPTLGALIIKKARTAADLANFNNQQAAALTEARDDLQKLVANVNVIGDGHLPDTNLSFAMATVSEAYATSKQIFNDDGRAMVAEHLPALLESFEYTFDLALKGVSSFGTWKFEALMVKLTSCLTNAAEDEDYVAMQKHFGQMRQLDLGGRRLVNTSMTPFASANSGWRRGLARSPTSSTRTGRSSHRRSLFRSSP